MSKILTLSNHASLYVSGVEVFHDVSELARRRIFTLIALIPPDEVPLLDPPFQQYFFPIDDAPDAPISQFFESTFTLIATTLLRGENVLVHCRAGISRSVTIILAFFLRTFRAQLHTYFVCPYISRHPREKWTDALYRFILRNRPQAQPNSGFVEQLYAYEARCITPENARC
jgi:hypothetical protein